jgi:hypothetical protein
MSGDRIVLTIPREEGYDHVAQLILGGVAARHNMTYESLDDLAIALDSLLERARDDDQVTVALEFEDGAIRTAVGPFPATVRGELEREIGYDVGLRRVLETVVDRVQVGDREDGQWVELTKRVAWEPPS